MQRDRKQTRMNILAAVGRLLARSGFREIGVNSIAREAEVDKVLIYRYFGGISELLKAFAEESDFWPEMQELEPGVGATPAGMTEAERAQFVMLSFGRALRKRPLTQEIMRWELLERNELTDALARYREAQGVTLFQGFEGVEDIDIRAAGSLLAAGLTYLILRSKTADVYNGLQLNSEEDWARIERAAGFLMGAAFAASGASKPPIKPGQKARKKRP